MKSRDLATLLDHPGSGGPVVLLAVGSKAQQSGSAARTAIELAESFAARGERVVLADLSLQNPELHSRLNVDNEEGLSDVFLFGASLAHITRTIPSRGFEFIPASAFTPDTAEVLQHAWWSHVFEELSAQQKKLLVYLPMDVHGAEAFSDRVGTTIILADSYAEEGAVQGKLSEDAEVLNAFALDLKPSSSVEPSPSPSPSPPGTRDDAAFEKIRIPKDGARDALIADLRKRQRDALMAPSPGLQPLPYEGGAPISARTAPAPDRIPVLNIANALPAPRRARWPLYAAAALIFLAGLGAYGWYRLVKSKATAAPQTGIEEPAVRAPVAPAPGQQLPFSVAIASYEQPSQAQERLDQLKTVENSIGFFIGPINVDGTLFYSVMAGPVPDSATAIALRDTLISRRIKTGSTGRDVLSTPFAFLLGEFANRHDAETTQLASETKGIPSYILDAVAEDGALRYRVYAGAYMGRGDAEFLRPLLKAAGFPDNLVERTGSIRP